MAAELLKLEPSLTVSGYLARHPAASFWTGKARAEACAWPVCPAESALPREGSA